jgi:CYTH domain-containing protein
MPIEIERKFLVRREHWHPDRTEGVPYRQGYLSTDPARVVRVRIAGHRAVLTVKGPTSGLSRLELEYAIPVREAVMMLEQLCPHPLVEKTRYRMTHDGRVWEVDEFSGENAGLILAEVELPSEATKITLPRWAGREVSGDPRYANANLACNPYARWPRDHDSRL